jgi:hypothetical protein
MWMNRIARAQYYAGSSWYDAEITRKEVVGNNIYITIVTQDSSELVITQFGTRQRRSRGGPAHGESVTKKSTQGVLMQFTSRCTKSKNRR